MVQFGCDCWLRAGWPAVVHILGDNGRIDQLLGRCAVEQALLSLQKSEETSNGRLQGNTGCRRLCARARFIEEGPGFECGLPALPQFLRPLIIGELGRLTMSGPPANFGRSRRYWARPGNWCRGECCLQ